MGGCVIKFVISNWYPVPYWVVVCRNPKTAVSLQYAVPNKMTPLENRNFCQIFNKKIEFFNQISYRVLFLIRKFRFTPSFPPKWYRVPTRIFRKNRPPHRLYVVPWRADPLIQVPKLRNYCLQIVCLWDFLNFRSKTQLWDE